MCPAEREREREGGRKEELAESRRCMSPAERASDREVLWRHERERERARASVCEIERERVSRRSKMYVPCRARESDRRHGAMRERDRERESERASVCEIERERVSGRSKMYVPCWGLGCGVYGLVFGVFDFGGYYQRETTGYEHHGVTEQSERE